MANLLSLSLLYKLASYSEAGPPEPVYPPALCYLSTISLKDLQYQKKNYNKKKYYKKNI